MFCLHAYLCTMCMQFPENQKMALGTLELELKIGDATTLGTGIEPRSSC